MPVRHWPKRGELHLVGPERISSVLYTLYIPGDHMQPPGIPDNEEQRLKSLYITGLLDTRDDERFERLTRLARKAFQVPL